MTRRKNVLTLAAWLLPLALPAAPANATISTIDTGGEFAWPSLKIGGDGLGLVAYYRHDLADLRVAHCSNPACTSATVTTLDSMGDVGGEASLAIGTDGLGLVAYRNQSSMVLKVAHCSNAACTSATLSTLDDGGFGAMGGSLSITIGSDGLGLITYSSFFQLSIAHCNDLACTSASFNSVAPAQYPNGASVSVGADGRALIVFMDMVANAMYAVHCADVACSSAGVNVVDVADSHDTDARPLAVLLGPDNLPLIAYIDGNRVLKSAHCLDAACATSTLSNLQIDTDRQDVAFSLGPDGRGWMAHQYGLYGGDLWIARCTNTACSAVASALVDDAGGIGGTVGNVSVARGRDNLPLLAYFTSEGTYPNTTPRLKVAHLDSLDFDLIFKDGFQ